MGVSDHEAAEAGLSSKTHKGTVTDAFRNRLMFPIFDVRGRVIAFSGRALDPLAKAKYKNTAESALYSKRKTVYGLSLAKNSPDPYFILTEGNIDVVTLHQHGFASGVATCGTALPADQAALLRRYKEEVVLTYDADKAGISAAQKAIPILDKAGLKVRVLRLPDGADPDDFLNRYGREAFISLLSGAEGQMDYRLQILKSGLDLSKDESKVEYLRLATQLLLRLGSEAERYVYAGRVSEAAGVSREAVMNDVRRAFRAREKKAEKQAFTELVYPKNTLDKAEELVISALLKHPEWTDKARARLKESDFSILRTLYSHILNGTTAYMLSEEESGVMARLSAADNIFTEQGFLDCVSRVLEQSALREALEHGSEPLLMKKFQLQKEQKKYGG
jgi:DNA primase